MQKLFARFATWSSFIMGTATAFALAVIGTLIWLFSGPLFGFSDTWQLVINTVTTVVTWLMIFLLQHTQNRDTRAVHLKLDELIRTSAEADSQLAEIEKEVED